MGDSPTCQYQAVRNKYINEQLNNTASRSYEPDVTAGQQYARKSTAAVDYYIREQRPEVSKLVFRRTCTNDSSSDQY